MLVFDGLVFLLTYGLPSRVEVVGRAERTELDILSPYVLFLSAYLLLQPFDLGGLLFRIHSGRAIMTVMEIVAVTKVLLVGNLVFVVVSVVRKFVMAHSRPIVNGI